MPPLTVFPRAMGAFLARSSSSPQFLLPVPFLAPLHHQPRNQQCRSVSIVSDLQNIPASYNKRIRRGRGASSGKGKTSGRGHKGQKQHGSVPAGFEGGQTPIAIVHGPRGWVNKYVLWKECLSATSRICIATANEIESIIASPRSCHHWIWTGYRAGSIRVGSIRRNRLLWRSLLNPVAFTELPKMVSRSSQR